MLVSVDWSELVFSQKTSPNHGTDYTKSENNSSTGLNSGFGNSQNIIDEDMKLAIQLQK